ncbi:unnamed protein product [Blepharisma stoltei]|uniref:dual-specificity kinase n=1 Tax=Blepharisma stoltei TaxID=1481888 RepID=A0AAU9K747_9CILI|nr:unnamed protein product [Blepharisma stoltei]
MEPSTSKIFKSMRPVTFNSPRSSVNLLKKKRIEPIRISKASSNDPKVDNFYPKVGRFQNFESKPKYDFSATARAPLNLNPRPLQQKLNKASSARNISASDFKYPHALSSSLKPTVNLIPKSEIHFPITPKIALTQLIDELSDFEKREVLEYAEIYYLGKNNCKIMRIEDGHNNGYDNDHSDYLLIKGDHIAYRYEVISMLGKGSFGQVCLCFDHKRQEQVAIKLIKNKKRFHHQAAIEIKVLRALLENDPNDKSNIVRMKNFFLFRSHVCLVFELLSINLYDLLKNNKFEGLSINLIRNFASQILSALICTKKLNIVHCDLKPENILLKTDSKSVIKVCDFGSSCFGDEIVYTYIQSRYYRSPEIILGIPYTPAIDMWSFGCMIYELYTGRPLFTGESEHEQLILIMELCGIPSDSMLNQSAKISKFFDEERNPKIVPDRHGNIRQPKTRSLIDILPQTSSCFIDFLTRCLEIDPDIRITPAEALQHPWILENIPHNGIRRKTTVLLKR